MRAKKLFKSLGLCIVLFLAGLLFVGDLFSDDVILFVSDRDETANWDLYQMNPDGTGIQRLTDSPSIDNHACLSPDRSSVVFSSDLTGNFEIYTAPLASLKNESTWKQLTSFGCGTTSPNRCTPARHPEWSPDGSEIIYTANDGCCSTTEIVTSHCSVPIQIVDPCGEHYEKIHIMKSDGTNDRVIDPLILGGGTCTTPVIFHCGHPDFHPDGDKIIFTAATTRDGDDWEVFIADWNGTEASNLTQVTQDSSYPSNPNPIKMSGGARFINEGEDIIFSSTRTWKGNSQLFVINDWEMQTLPLSVGDDLRVTWHCGNDYVPEELHDTNGKVAYTSDAKDSWDNPTDLDLWIMEPDGSGRTNLTNNPTNPEELMIADEVSWFCGMPRNLAPCTFAPRAVSIESKYLMWQSSHLLSDDYPRKDQYNYYINELSGYLETHYSDYFNEINESLSTFLSQADDDMDGLPNEDPEDGIDNDGDGQIDEDPPSNNEMDIATKQIVIPSLMPPTEEWCADCVPCDECVKIETSCPLPDGMIGDPYSETFQANNSVTWKIFAGDLPSGLTLDQSTGVISGTPTQSGTSSFSLAALDSKGNADSLDCTITIAGGATCLNVSPDEGTQGDQNLQVTITGQDTNFVQGETVVSFENPGITIDDTTVDSPTQVTVTVNIASNAITGTGDVTVTTDTEVMVCANAFKVLGIASPIWQSVNEVLYDDPNDLVLLRAYRDDYLKKTIKGKIYTFLLYMNSQTALNVLVANPELIQEAKQIVGAIKGAVSEVLEGREGVISNTSEIVSFLNAYAQESSPVLKLLTYVVKKEVQRKKERGELYFGFRLK